MGITFLIQLCGYWSFQFEDWELDFEVIKMLILRDCWEWEESNVDTGVDEEINTEEEEGLYYYHNEWVNKGLIR